MTLWQNTRALGGELCLKGFLRFMPKYTIPLYLLQAIRFYCDDRIREFERLDEFHDSQE